MQMTHSFVGEPHNVVYDCIKTIQNKTNNLLDFNGNIFRRQISEKIIISTHFYHFIFNTVPLFYAVNWHSSVEHVRM